MRIIMRTVLLLTLINIFVSGCATSDKENENSGFANSHPSNQLHWHVEKLTRQLLTTSQVMDPTQTLAVGTILPTTLSSGGSLPDHSSLGRQIQESLLTFATQAGLKVIEFKTMPNIKVAKMSDKMLSREISELNKTIAADYFLTGTYTQQESQIMVNIRLIQIPENIVLAAATDYVPNDVMWSNSKVTLKNNQLYRNGY